MGQNIIGVAILGHSERFSPGPNGPEVEATVGGYKLNHLTINSTTAVAADARVNPALPATAVVEFMAKWLNLYPRTV